MNQVERQLARALFDQVGWRNLWLCGLLFVLGCGSSQEVSDLYGHRRGKGVRSVNGTAVLGEMFKQAGFRVSSWRRLSPKLARDQVIFWAPDDFEPPATPVTDYLEKWLAAKPNRTLIYVARDYNAAIDFWEQVLVTAPPEQRIEIRRELARARSGETAAREKPHDREGVSMTCEWFSLEAGGRKKLQHEKFSGPWSDGVDFSKSGITVQTRVKPPNQKDRASLRIRSLLESSEAVVATELRRVRWQGSKIILITNGSWLLNLPLVNPEHRVLAKMLIDECGPPSRVCFLESGPSDLRISETDSTLPLMLRAFTVWPVNVILLHLTVLGIFFCFAVFPIFGRPKRLPPEALSDFGRHVTAVGELLERAGDETQARRQIETYREKSHPK
ncbi:MAG: hypothetical protein P8N76_22120 [Pirellulaceae bacterium]|nr:hypothetical protein [Pirellulaceae bacterium]